MSVIDWTERVAELVHRTRGADGSEAPWSAEDDPGIVPARVMPALCSLAQSIGYPVELTTRLPEGVLGRTSKGTVSASLNKIEIRDGMSQASTARVIGHELGHALRGLDTQQDFYSLLFNGPSNPQEEAYCELGTAAFCEASGIGTGAFLHRYLGQHLRGSRVMTSTVKDAARLAQALWRATHSTSK